jgi:4a-hydroxytetrahydrobiopterin dehydratase
VEHLLLEDLPNETSEASGLVCPELAVMDPERTSPMSLVNEFCEACRPGSPSVTEDEREELLLHIPDWDIQVITDVPRLRRTFRFDGWTPAVAFTNRVADLAESQGHHPQIRLEWGRVTVSWWTHAIRNLHRNDFIMAARTDQVYLEGGPDD